MAFVNLIPYEVAQAQGTADNWYRMLQAERAAQAQEIDNQRNRYNAALTLRGLDVADRVRQNEDRYSMANLLESIRQSREDDALRAQDLSERLEDRRRRLQQEDEQLGWQREAASDNRQLRRDALEQANKRNLFESAFRQVQVAPVDPAELDKKFATVLDPTQMMELHALNNRAIQEKYLDPNARSEQYAGRLNLANAMRKLDTGMKATEEGDERSKVVSQHWAELMGETPMPKRNRSAFVGGWFRDKIVDEEAAETAFTAALAAKKKQLEDEVAEINKALTRDRMAAPRIATDGSYASGVTVPAFVKTASSGGVKRRFVFNPATGEAVLQ